MIKLDIKIPEKFEKERKFVLNTFFDRFENLQINFSTSSSIIETQILLEQKLIICIKDVLWKEMREEIYSVEQYALPSSPQPTIVQSAHSNKTIISLYGAPKIEEDNGVVTFETDIIGASFFLLTRMEEVLKNFEKDEHGRFPDKECYLIQHNLQTRPIINEYIDVLKTIIEKQTGNKMSFELEYNVAVSHDIDEIFQLFPLNNLIRTIAADIVYRRSLVLAFRSFIVFIRSIFNKKNDPFYTFDYLMDVSDRHNLLSEFYFIPGKKGETDYRYAIKSKRLKTIISSILTRGHIVGIHPSYTTFKNAQQLSLEVKRLNEVSGQKTSCGRQHFLRFSVPETWQAWESLGLKKDSSVGFIDHVGFKTGICYKHKVFDIFQRRTLGLINHPLTVMEVALKRDEISPEKFKDEVVKLAKTTAQYNGDFMLLWHNNNLHNFYWKAIGAKYEEIISAIKNAPADIKK
jgi:hypothetical protein